MEHVGVFIQEERKKNRLSQRDLASKANISNTELWKIENGERNNPNPVFLKSIALALNIDYKILLAKANYLDSTNSTIISISTNTFNQKKILEIKETIMSQVIEELNSEFSEILEVQYNFRINYDIKLDTICFSKLGNILGIDSNYIISHKKNISNYSFFLNQLRKKIKSNLADFYFYFKKQGYQEDKLTFLCIFILNNSINELDFKQFIDTSFMSFKPFFKYKIFYDNSNIKK